MERLGVGLHVRAGQFSAPAAQAALKKVSGNVAMLSPGFPSLILLLYLTMHNPQPRRGTMGDRPLKVAGDRKTTAKPSGRVVTRPLGPAFAPTGGGSRSSYEPGGREFESLRARHINYGNIKRKWNWRSLGFCEKSELGSFWEVFGFQSRSLHAAPER